MEEIDHNSILLSKFPGVGSYHIDILDGSMGGVANLWIIDWLCQKSENFLLPYDVHIMSKTPEKILLKLPKNYRMVYCHKDLTSEFDNCGIVISDMKDIKKYSSTECSRFLFLTGTLGANGSHLQHSKLKYPFVLSSSLGRSIDVGIDGGVCDTNFQKVLESHPQKIIIGSYLPP